MSAKNSKSLCTSSNYGITSISITSTVKQCSNIPIEQKLLNRLADGWTTWGLTQERTTRGIT